MFRWPLARSKGPPERTSQEWEVGGIDFPLLVAFGRASRNGVGEPLPTDSGPSAAPLRAQGGRRKGESSNPRRTASRTASESEWEVGPVDFPLRPRLGGCSRARARVQRAALACSGGFLPGARSHRKRPGVGSQPRRLPTLPGLRLEQLPLAPAGRGAASRDRMKWSVRFGGSLASGNGATERSPETQEGGDIDFLLRLILDPPGGTASANGRPRKGTAVFRWPLAACKGPPEMTLTAPSPSTCADAPRANRARGSRPRSSEVKWEVGGVDFLLPSPST